LNDAAHQVKSAAAGAGSNHRRRLSDVFPEISRTNAVMEIEPTTSQGECDFPSAA